MTTGTLNSLYCFVSLFVPLLCCTLVGFLIATGNFIKNKFPNNVAFFFFGFVCIDVCTLLISSAGCLESKMERVCLRVRNIVPTMGL